VKKAATAFREPIKVFNSAKERVSMTAAGPAEVSTVREGTPVDDAMLEAGKGVCEAADACRLGPNMLSIMGRICWPRGVFKKSAGRPVMWEGIDLPTRNWQTSSVKELQLLSKR
jgi:hypothetical protein